MRTWNIWVAWWHDHCYYFLLILCIPF